VVLAYRVTLEHKRKDWLPKVETPIKMFTDFLVIPCAIVQTSGPTVIRYGAKELKPSAYVREKSLGLPPHVTWNGLSWESATPGPLQRLGLLGPRFIAKPRVGRNGRRVNLFILPNLSNWVDIHDVRM